MLLYLFLNFIITSHFCTVIKKPSLDPKSKFPIYEDDNFVMEIHTANRELPRYTAVVLRCKLQGQVMEEHVLNPGFLKSLPTRLNGQHFLILNYKVKPYLVEVTLQFKRPSNNGQLEVIFVETESRSHRISVVDQPDKHTAYRIGTLAISLWLHWKVTLIQRTMDHREGGLVVDSSSILVCRATDGFPFSAVRFIGVDDLQAARSLSVPVTPQSLSGPSILMASNTVNEAQMSFHSKIGDHLKTVGCQAGQDVVYDTIKIFHHPTKLEITPYIYGYVRNGTSIHCTAKDGYPTPKVRWAWVFGPEHSDRYFSINASNKVSHSVLYIDNSAPLKSKWVFECLSTNTIPNSLDNGKIESVSFIIGVKPIPYILICSIVLGIILLLTLFVVVVYLCNTSKCSRSPVTKMNSLTKQSTIFVLNHTMTEDNDENMSNVSIDKTLLQQVLNPVDAV